jgi:hypothetical protein
MPGWIVLGLLKVTSFVVEALVESAVGVWVKKIFKKKK